MWLFDNYVIPLAKKFQTCGVSCDELLDYAWGNRAQWSMKANNIVKENVPDMLNLHHESNTIGVDNTDGPIGVISNIYFRCI